MLGALAWPGHPAHTLCLVSPCHAPVSALSLYAEVQGGRASTPGVTCALHEVSRVCTVSSFCEFALSLRLSSSIGFHLFLSALGWGHLPAITFSCFPRSHRSVLFPQEWTLDRKVHGGL